MLTVENLHLHYGASHILRGVDAYIASRCITCGTVAASTGPGAVTADDDCVRRAAARRRLHGLCALRATLARRLPILTAGRRRGFDTSWG